MSQEGENTSFPEIFSKISFIRQTYKAYLKNSLDNKSQFERAIYIQKSLFSSPDIQTDFLDDLSSSSRVLEYISNLSDLAFTCDLINDKMSVQIWRYYYVLMGKDVILNSIRNLHQNDLKVISESFLRSLKHHGILRGYLENTRATHAKVFLCVAKIYTQLLEALIGLEPNSIILQEMSNDFLSNLVLMFLDVLDNTDESEVYKKHQENLSLAIEMSVVKLISFNLVESPKATLEYAVSLVFILRSKVPINFKILRLFFQTINQVKSKTPVFPPRLYKFLMIQLCLSIYRLRKEEVASLERILLRVIFTGTRLSALIAVDLWCFICRLVSTNYIISLIRVNLHYLTSSVESSSSNSTIMLAFFTSRILLFCPAKKRLEILQEYPITAKSHVWMDHLAHFFPLDTCIGSQKILFQDQLETTLQSSSLEPIKCHSYVRLILKCLPLNKISQYGVQIVNLFINNLRYFGESSQKATSTGSLEQIILRHVWKLYRETLEVDLLHVALLDSTITSDEQASAIICTRKFLFTLIASLKRDEIVDFIAGQLGNVLSTKNSAQITNRKLAFNPWIVELRKWSDPSIVKMIGEKFCLSESRDNELPHKSSVHTRNEEESNILLELDKTVDRLFHLLDSAVNDEPKPGIVRRKVRDLVKRLNLY